MMIVYFGMRVDFCLLVNSCSTQDFLTFQYSNMKTSSDLFLIAKYYSPRKKNETMYESINDDYLRLLAFD